jgi:hypothetical protein
MYRSLIFFNEFGAGDIFESREFIKEWASKVPAKNYYYAHGKHKRIIADIPWIESIDFNKNIMDSMKDVIVDSEENLYINTWIGRDSQYVLPGIGCVVEQFHRMNNDMMKKYGIGQLNLPPIHYIPKVDYTYYDRMSVHKFLSKHKQDRILICNGTVNSNQAFNFDFTEAICELAAKFKDKVFITTSKLNEERGNIFHTGDFIDTGYDFDLNEISYLSNFCNTIIGRKSGPYVFCHNLNNCMNPNKKFISFTYQQTGSSFVVNTAVRAQKYWSPATDSYGVARFIEGVILNG